MMKRIGRHLVVMSAATAMVAGLAIVMVAGQQPAAQSVYTAEQAGAGRTAYETSCAGCHVADLGGRNEAPQLAGGDFMNSWRTRTTKDLFEFIQATMPPGGPTLSADQYLNIASYILQRNGAVAGSQPLTPTTEAAIGSVAGARPAAPAAAAADPQRGAGAGRGAGRGQAAGRGVN